ncbi:AAA family ATPase [Rhizobium sp. 22-785-1]
MRKALEKTSAVARITCTLALRETLKKIKNIIENRAFSVVVRVPNELLKEFVDAATDLPKIMPGVEDIEVCEAIKGLKGGVDFSEINSALRLADRVLIVVRCELPLPRTILAAVDAVIDVDPIGAETIARAVCLLEDRDFPVDQIERMLAYPIADVLAAIRPGRDADFALERLREAHSRGDISDDPPPIEHLHGYGMAADWARNLASDLDAWRRGTISWSEIDAGLLLSGPSGVGKSMFAKAVAKSCDMSFVSSSLAQWQSRGHLGDLLQAMRTTFEEATAKAPCVLLLDEFDSIGDRARFDERSAQYCTEVVSGLLECLDGISRRDGVVVVGACNHPQRIDAALLRPGRLGTHIRVALPDLSARTCILRGYLPEGLSDQQIAQAALECDGFTGADLAHVAKGALRIARRRGEALTIDDLRAALPPSTPIEGELRRRIAVHEAGHAAVGLALEVGELTGVVVRHAFRQSAPVGGGTVFEDSYRLRNSQYFLDAIAMGLGGMAAEIVVYGEHLDGSGGGLGSDLHSAADQATAMIAQAGMGRKLGYFNARDQMEREKLRRALPALNRQVEQTLDTQLARAIDLVRKRLDFVNELADILDKEGAVDGDRARALFRHGGSPAPMI